MKAKVTRVILIGVITSAGALFAAPLSQNEGEFAQAGKLPSAAEAVKIPNERSFAPTGFAVDKLSAQLRSQVGRRLQGAKLKTLLKDSQFVRDVLALDAIETAGEGNIAALSSRAPKYAAFARWFLSNREALLLYAGAGDVPKNTEVGWRVLADIWARDCASPDFREYLPLAVGIATSWGAGATSSRLQYQETLPAGRDKCDPVWRYFFYKTSHQAGILHKNFMKLRPWEIRFVAGNPWDDDSFYFLQQRINLPPDRYGWACWCAKYSGTSPLGESIQGPLFYVTAPPSMCDAERICTVGGVCGALSTVGAHAASARGIPAYTVGQPGHCAYAFRPERGNWQGGFGGPDGGPHNWLFPGIAPVMTRLAEAAFADDRKVDHAVTVLAFARAGYAEAWPLVAKAWPHNYFVQREYLDRIVGDPKALKSHAIQLANQLQGHGFAAWEIFKPYFAQIKSSMTAAELQAWYLSLNRAMATAKPSWAVKNLPEILNVQVEGMDDATLTKFLGELFSIYAGNINDQALGQLLEWSVSTFVPKGREAVFAKAFEKLSAPASGGKGLDKATFAKAITAAEKAGSRMAVDVLSDRAIASGFSSPFDPNRAPVQVDPTLKLVSEDALLTTSSTCGWDSPADHRNVLRNVPGSFHTDAEANPWALVRLNGTKDVAEIVIVARAGFESRTSELRISRSTDGATFFPVAETHDAKIEWRVKLDSPQPAGWIKVERIGESRDPMHLRNILIFSKGAKK